MNYQRPAMDNRQREYIPVSRMTQVNTILNAYEAGEIKLHDCYAKLDALAYQARINYLTADTAAQSAHWLRLEANAQLHAQDTRISNDIQRSSA